MLTQKCWSGAGFGDQLVHSDGSLAFDEKLKKLQVKTDTDNGRF
jgi:hypothetical protein